LVGSFQFNAARYDLEVVLSDESLATPNLPLVSPRAQQQLPPPAPASEHKENHGRKRPRIDTNTEEYKTRVKSALHSAIAKCLDPQYFEVTVPYKVTCKLCKPPRTYEARGNRLQVIRLHVQRMHKNVVWHSYHASLSASSLPTASLLSTGPVLSSSNASPSTGLTESANHTQ